MTDAISPAVRRVSMARPRRRAVLAALACAALLPQLSARAQGMALENQVKAAYLYKFASFTEWPAGTFARPDSPLLIAVAGNDAVARELEQIVAARTVAGHPVQVRRLKPGDSPAGVHMLYIGALERAAAAALLAQARSLPVLTVSDADDGLALGAMINFLIDQERLRFDVALRQVALGRLRISARMLAAAHKVEGEAT